MPQFRDSCLCGSRSAATSGARPRVLLHELCSGSQIILPPARSERQPNPQLEARREELRRKLEDMQYADMVKDITKTEREAESMKEMLPTYQVQMASRSTLHAVGLCQHMQTGGRAHRAQ